MASDFFLVQGNRLPLLDEFLIGANKQPIDLTGLSVIFRMRGQGNCSGRLIQGAASILDARGGAVRYSWAAGDTDVPGTYLGEWEINVNGLPMTVPNVDYVTVKIRPKV